MKSMDPSCFISEEEEKALLSGTFMQSTTNKTVDDHMRELEMSIREMGIQSPGHSLKPDGHLERSFGKLHSQVDARVLENLKIALEDIPSGTEGLDECKKLVSSSKSLTLQDVLVVQYVLNNGLIMLQNHGTDDEYQVDIS